MRARHVILPIASLVLSCLLAPGCILETARRDGAQCSEANTCPPGQQCSSDGQCLYPCPQSGCQGSECGCGERDRGQDNMGGSGFSGWTCLGDGLCHYNCGNGGTDCIGFMNCGFGFLLAFAFGAAFFTAFFAALFTTFFTTFFAAAFFTTFFAIYTSLY